jgi:hypothetical protein
MLLFICAFIALMFGLAHAQAIKVGTSGAIGAIGIAMLVPALGVALYAIWREMGWWTIAVFVLASIVVGVFHATAIRSQGLDYLLNMQPIYTIVFVTAGLACAFLLFS